MKEKQGDHPKLDYASPDAELEDVWGVNQIERAASKTHTGSYAIGLIAGVLVGSWTVLLSASFVGASDIFRIAVYDLILKTALIAAASCLPKPYRSPIRVGLYVSFITAYLNFFEYWASSRAGHSYPGP